MGALMGVVADKGATTRISTLPVDPLTIQSGVDGGDGVDRSGRWQ
jgi:hypothetical protein